MESETMESHKRSYLGDKCIQNVHLGRYIVNSEIFARVLFYILIKLLQNHSVFTGIGKSCLIVNFKRGKYVF